MRSRNWPMTSSFRNGRDTRQQTDAMESTEPCGGRYEHDDGMETATYEDARDSGPLTAERSGPTPSTAKRFRSMGIFDGDHSESGETARLSAGVPRPLPAPPDAASLW